MPCEACRCCRALGCGAAAFGVDVVSCRARQPVAVYAVLRHGTRGPGDRNLADMWRFADFLKATPVQPRRRLLRQLAQWEPPFYVPEDGGAGGEGKILGIAGHVREGS